MATLTLLLENTPSLKSKFFVWSFYFLISGLLAYLLSLGAIQAPDSAGYLQTSFLRSPGYPLFLKFTQVLAGKHAEILLVIVQLLLGVWATLLIAKTFQKLFELKQIFFILFSIILLTPYLGKTGNYILTEGLAYPLFLFSIYHLLRGIIYRDNLALGSHLIFLPALVLTRGQFLFMYGVAFLGILYSFTYNRSLRKKMLLIALCLGSLLFSNIFDRAYHLFYHGTFSSTPATGIHLCIQPFYISNLEDGDLFQDPREKHLFLEVRQKMEEKKLSHPFAAGYTDPPYHFYTCFNDILYRTLYPALSRQGFKDAVEVDSRLEKMAIKLIINRPLPYFKLYIRNLTGLLGGCYGALTLLVIFIGSAFYAGRFHHTLSICLSVCSLVMLMNAFLVALLQPALIRYTFYTETLLCCLVLVVFYNYIKNDSLRKGL